MMSALLGLSLLASTAAFASEDCCKKNKECCRKDGSKCCKNHKKADAEKK
jgi:hypothetical protein